MHLEEHERKDVAKVIRRHNLPRSIPHSKQLPAGVASEIFARLKRHTMYNEECEPHLFEKDFGLMNRNPETIKCKANFKRKNPSPEYILEIKGEKYYSIKGLALTIGTTEAYIRVIKQRQNHAWPFIPHPNNAKKFYYPASVLDYITTQQKGRRTNDRKRINSTRI